MKTARLLIAVLACLALAQPIATHASAPDIPAPHGSVPHAARSTRPPVVLIVLENHEFGSIVRSSSARWLNRSFIRRGTLFTSYHATHHPSLPNYLAMTSGTTSGCRSDTCPRRTYRTDSIFHQLSHAGIGWASWIESMPSRCSLSSSGTYAVKHNPPAYYSSLFPRLCRARDRRYPGHLPSQLRPFTFVSPNLCHDMHSCSIGTGDRWLARHVPPLWKRGAIVIITFDEGSSGTEGGGHVMTAIAGPHVPRGRRNHRSYSHYGLLAGLEHWFGLPRLHRAATARPLPI